MDIMELMRSLHSCPKCGNKISNKENLFCGFCGCNLEQELMNAKQCPECGSILRDNGFDSPQCEVCGYIELSTDYEGRCGNCHKSLNDDDKYCRYCGTKRGEGAFKPYQNVMYCIYGPMPVKRTHKCKKCGNTWETMLMIDNEDFCPICGSKTKVYEEID